MKNDFYAPGEAFSYKSRIFNLIPEEHLAPGKLKPEWISKKWFIPKRVKGTIGDGRELSPYRPWRRIAKSVIFDRLKIMPEQISAHMSRKIPSDIPQPPTAFLDGVPNFSEIPAFAGNLSFGEVEDQRGEWGQLISALTETGVKLLEREKARYEAMIQRDEATLIPQKEKSAISEWIPYVLISLGVFSFLKLGQRRK
ncbi:MAG: hypothetical protein K6T87_15975 [Roseiflexus sp.]|uniref:hypothetical protein n=1 Tax=Roseiflexus sp. TaxID=2562120 RepID=UPI0026012B17|nr:hypothetical protein [Roseiflexus sp.]MCL6542054.1 hypothetical protein [Roseiflexus sp.]